MTGKLSTAKNRKQETETATLSAVGPAGGEWHQHLLHQRLHARPNLLTDHRRYVCLGIVVRLVDVVDQACTLPP